MRKGEASVDLTKLSEEKKTWVDIAVVFSLKREDRGVHMGPVNYYFFNRCAKERH